MDTPSSIKKDDPKLENPHSSGWAMTFAVIGILLILVGVVSILLALEKSGVWIYTAILIGAGLQCCFCSFLVDVFTDMRWYLKKLVEQTRCFVPEAEKDTKEQSKPGLNQIISGF